MIITNDCIIIGFNMSENNSTTFNFNNSLKKGPKYPIINHIRIERYFTRPLASVFVKLVYNSGITPNHITVFAFFLGITAAIFFSLGEHKYFIVGGLLLQLSSVFDCADGMLARSKNICTRYGAFLDLFLDRLVDVFIFIGISVGYFIYSESISFLIISLIMTALVTLQTSLIYLIRVFQNDFVPGESAEVRGILIFVIFILSVLNRFDILFIIVLIQSLFIISVRTIIIYRLRSGNGTNIPEF